MRGWALTLACVMAMTLGPEPAAAEDPRPLRFVTYNVFHGGPSSGLRGDAAKLDQRLVLAARALAELAPDVVAVQEASSGLGRRNVAERLAERLGFEYVHAPATSRLFPMSALNWLAVHLINFSEGPALLSRWPIVGSEVYDLPRCRRYLDPRVMLGVVLRTPWGDVNVYSVHTSNDPCQAKRIGEIVDVRRGRLPSIVMGDFNALESAPAIAALRQEHGFVDAFRALNAHEPGLTSRQMVGDPERTVRRRIDYVFVVRGNESPGRVIGSRIVLDAPGQADDGSALWPSDHYGVLADVDLVRAGVGHAGP
jgi:endonuclease/exonuclease/phosphatase family metal-dependent hydrolase